MHLFIQIDKYAYTCLLYIINEIKLTLYTYSVWSVEHAEKIMYAKIESNMYAQHFVHIVSKNVYEYYESFHLIS